MGFRYRKSIRVGKFFRINVSKSGIGYSFGVPGARVTHSANGRVTTTVGIPGTGLSYSQSYTPNHNTSHNNRSSNSQQALPDNGIGPEMLIESASIENFQPAEMQDLIKALKNARAINTMGNVFAVIGIVFLLACVIGIHNAIIGGTCSIIAGICKYLASHNMAVHLDYKLDEEANYQHEKRINAWDTFLGSRMTWQVTSQANVYNQKTHAGATSSIHRECFKHSNKLPIYIKSNQRTIVLKLKKEQLFLFPDKILIMKGSSIGAISYDTVHISTNKGQFVESGIVPIDAEVVRYTWQYVNKNGSPDRRFSNNRQIPVCLYGYVIIKSNSGLNIELSCSNHNNIIDF